MTRKRLLLVAVMVVTVLALGGTVGFVLAQGGDAEDVRAQEDVELQATVDNQVPVQGRLTDATGTPINGSRSVVFTLYDAATDGTAVCTDNHTVTFVNGLFTALVNHCTHDDINGRQLYLGIRVDADAEMTPRQAIYPVPYAFSLRPGAIISGTLSGDAALHVENWAATGRAVRGYAMSEIGTNFGVVGASRSPDGYGGFFYNHEEGIGVCAEGSGAGLSAPALLVTNTNASGIGAWISTDSSDAALVVSNEGSGNLFKGFGNDGGDDEFRITNGGAVQSKADSYFWIPGNALVKYHSSDTTRWDVQRNGGVKIYRGETSGGKAIFLPVTIPAVLYGQSVEIESVRVYYKCSNGANAYIMSTFLYKQADADSEVAIMYDGWVQSSNTATSYALVAVTSTQLSSSQGILGLCINLNFYNDVDYVQLGGVRFQLGHHPLY